MKRVFVSYYDLRRGSETCFCELLRSKTMELVIKHTYKDDGKEIITEANEQLYKYAVSELRKAVDKLLVDDEFKLIDDAFRKQVRFTSPEEYRDAYMTFISAPEHEKFAKDVHRFKVTFYNVKRFEAVVPLTESGVKMS